MIELFWLLLPVAAASGWWAARRADAEHRGMIVRGADYFKGLNYLIDEQPDQAIEVFTRMADVDRDTAEIHLALGNLFRRRGEVDRALHIHGSLMARTTLTVEQKCRAMLELGEDYLRAGLFDRAEELFRHLLEQPDHTAIALSRLIRIFQQEKEWRQAPHECYAPTQSEAALHHNDAQEQDDKLQHEQHDAPCECGCPPAGRMYPVEPPTRVRR